MSALTMNAMGIDTFTPSVRTHLHLTRRGRRVLAAVIAAPIVLGFAAFALDGGAVATSTATDDTFTYISVASGESLWDIAGVVAPESDPREVIADIVRLNALDSAAVQPGERLAIPHEYED